jgi:hypothetical protein
MIILNLLNTVYIECKLICPKISWLKQMFYVTVKMIVYKSSVFIQIGFSLFIIVTI